MTRKELKDIKSQYREIPEGMLESREDAKNEIFGICRGLANEMCYNHHERGQRLWALFQALGELEEK